MNLLTVLRCALLLAASAHGAFAQTAADRPVIGYLNNGSPENAEPHLAAFKEGLGREGFVDGVNVSIEYRFAGGRDDRLAALASELVAKRVRVIATSQGNVAARAAQRATNAIPIVFALGGDPVSLGLVASINKPGGNVTGATFNMSTIESKKLELLRGFKPGIAAAGVLLNPGNGGVASTRADYHAGAASLGITLREIPVTKVEEIAPAIEAFARDGGSSLIVVADAMLSEKARDIAALALSRKIALIASQREFVMLGALASHGASRIEAFRDAGGYVGKILKGQKPSELPVLQPRTIETVINVAVAKTLGIIVPDILLATADEVIE